MMLATFLDPRNSSDQWIKFNMEQVGFYRVNMPEELWGLIQHQLVSNYKVSVLW